MRSVEEPKFGANSNKDYWVESNFYISGRLWKFSVISSESDRLSKLIQIKITDARLIKIKNDKKTYLSYKNIKKVNYFN